MVEVDPFELVLDADRLVLPLEVDDVECARYRRGRPGRVDDDVGVHRLVAGVADALDDAVVVEHRPRHACVEPILRTLLATVLDEEALELGELEDGAGLVRLVVVVRRLQHHGVRVRHHDVVGNPERRHHRRERPRRRLVALSWKVGFGLGLEDDDVVPAGGEVTSTLGARWTGAGDGDVVAIRHV